MKQNETDLVQKSSEKFHCELCDYNTCRKSQYERHLLTPKHKNNDNNDINDDILVQKSSKLFTCDCGKNYKYRQGLHNHRKHCVFLHNEIIKPEDKSVSESEIKILIVIEIL